MDRRLGSIYQVLGSGFRRKCWKRWPENSGLERLVCLMDHRLDSIHLVLRLEADL